MDKETKDIIQKIATIQVEALTNILNNFDNLNPSEHDMLKDLLFIIPESKEEVIDTIKNRIQGYQEIVRYPNLIKAIDEQQLYICSHILFQMEEEWLLDNS